MAQQNQSSTFGKATTANPFSQTITANPFGGSHTTSNGFMFGYNTPSSNFNNYQTPFGTNMQSTSHTPFNGFGNHQTPSTGSIFGTNMQFPSQTPSSNFRFGGNYSNPFDVKPPVVETKGDPLASFNQLLKDNLQLDNDSVPITSTTETTHVDFSVASTVETTPTDSNVLDKRVTKEDFSTVTKKKKNYFRRNKGNKGKFTQNPKQSGTKPNKRPVYNQRTFLNKKPPVSDIIIVVPDESDDDQPTEQIPVTPIENPIKPRFENPIKPRFEIIYPSSSEENDEEIDTRKNDDRVWFPCYSDCKCCKGYVNMCQDKKDCNCEKFHIL